MRRIKIIFCSGGCGKVLEGEGRVIDIIQSNKWQMIINDKEANPVVDYFCPECSG